LTFGGRNAKLGAVSDHVRLPEVFADQPAWGRAGGWLLRQGLGLLARLFYPRIEITLPAPLPATGGVLLVANHPNSVMDLALLGQASRRPVHFFARASLFQIPLLGACLRALGMLPYYRSADGPAQSRLNARMIEAAANFLARGEVVAVFPEGESHDALKVERIHTGAARIALKAAAVGRSALAIVPVGLNYERKEQFRSAVWVRAGEPLVVEAAAEEGPAIRALNRRIEERLREVVIHLSEERWAPFLGDLEVLLPAARNELSDPVRALRQRKRIADAINHFTARAPEETTRLAQAIEALRGRVAAAGLDLRSPVLHHQGWRGLARMCWQTLRLLAGLFPVLLGVLHHVAPYWLTRVIAGEIHRRRRSREALTWLAIGLPLFGGWYAVVWWWIVRLEYVPEAAWAWTLAMPGCGLLAVRQGRRALEAFQLWRHQIVILFNRGRLQDLRAEANAIEARLEEMMRHFRERHPAETPPEKPFPWRWLLGRVIGWGLGLAAALALLVWAATRAEQRSLAELIYPGPDLGLWSANSLAWQLEADEKALGDILKGLEELELTALKVQGEFASGQRSYYSQADDDAVRQLLLAYINYRAALLRLVWKYQQHERIADERLRLRSALCQLAAGSALFDSSLKLVTLFRRPETIRKLNEAEPRWGIPPNLHDTIRRNLAHSANRRMLEKARLDYHRQLPAFASQRLVETPPYPAFHAAIQRAAESGERLLPHLKATDVKVAIKDARDEGDAALYRAKSYVTAWIGDAKIRQPREGQSLITPPQVRRLREMLRPGDILVERRNWFLSNAFLPGFWPHAALYTGSAADLRRMGLDQDPRVRPHWEKFVRHDDAGHPLVIIEAVSEGVIFASLEHSIGGGDAAAVMRPRLPPERIREAIARAFSHAGKPYDFEFDFFSSDKLVCTELVFRAYDGDLDFPLVKVLGRKTMPALELVRKCCLEHGKPAAQLEFVAFIDGDERRGTSAFKDFSAFQKTLDRPGLDWLQ